MMLHVKRMYIKVMSVSFNCVFFVFAFLNFEGSLIELDLSLISFVLISFGLVCVVLFRICIKKLIHLCMDSSKGRFTYIRFYSVRFVCVERLWFPSGTWSVPRNCKAPNSPSTPLCFILFLYCTDTYTRNKKLSRRSQF